MIIAIAWIPFCAMLHLAIHEGAHYVVARLNGCIGITVHLWPKRLANGRFVFAYVHVPTLYLLSPANRVRFYTAPLLAEAIVWITAMTALGLGVAPWLRWILAVEMVVALVDASIWVFPYWRQVHHPGTDAEETRATAGFTVMTGRIRSSGLLGFFTFTGLVIWRSVLHG